MRQADLKLYLLWLLLLLYSVFQLTTSLIGLLDGKMKLVSVFMVLSNLSYNSSHWTLGWYYYDTAVKARFTLEKIQKSSFIFNTIICLGYLFFIAGNCVIGYIMLFNQNEGERMMFLSMGIFDLLSTALIVVGILKMSILLKELKVESN